MRRREVPEADSGDLRADRAAAAATRDTVGRDVVSRVQAPGRVR